MTREPTEMELRVALAIYKRKTVMPNGELHLMKKTPWEKLQNISRVKYLNDARAAIRAMRQETDAMNDAGSDVVDARMLAETGFCGPIWHAMIDAASPKEE